MINGSYAAISAQLALQRRLDTIAHNVANAGTVGFRSELVRFKTVESEEARPATSFLGTGATYLSFQSGDMVRTDNPFDIAIDGNAWLAVETPQGVALSRDGRLQVTTTGELRTLTGHAVLDAGGSPILLNPADGPPVIGRDGSLTQAGRQLGAIGLFALPGGAKLTRGVDGTVLTGGAPVPIVDSPSVGVRQGFVEKSNVNTVAQMSQLILDQRLLEAVTSAVSDLEQTRTSALRTLGGSAG